MHQELIDNHGRRIDYLRLSVTDRCNQRCFYCLPKGAKDFEPPSNWLTEEETVRIAATFARLGVRRIRFTGGEPLVRKGLASLVARIGVLDDVEELSLSTNASVLARHADSLRHGGIRRINVSLDSLRPERYREITCGELASVLDGLQVARSVGFEPIKINMLVMRGVNDDEVGNMLDFCIENDFTLRFIETMPVGAGGRRATGHYIALDEVRENLSHRYELLPGIMAGGGPARYARVSGTDVTVGFISPMSQHFCPSCNRVRLTVEGRLLLCLGQEDSVDLRSLLRNGASDDALEAAIRNAMACKPERHQFNELPEKVARFMSYSGG